MSDFKVDEAAASFKEGGTWRWKDDNIAGSALGAMLVVEGLSRLGAEACAHILEIESCLAFERAKVAELRLALHVAENGGLEGADSNYEGDPK